MLGRPASSAAGHGPGIRCSSSLGPSMGLQAAGAQRQRDILPLPARGTAAQDGGRYWHLSHGCRQRVARRQAIDDAMLDVTMALNDLAGASGACGMAGGSAAQGRALASLRQQVSRFPRPQDAPSAQEALRELLRSDARYDSECTGAVAPYNPETLSVPGSASGAPQLVHMLDAAAADTVCAVCGRDATVR